MTEDMEVCGKTTGDIEDGIHPTCDDRPIKEVRVVSCSIKTDVPARYLHKFFEWVERGTRDVVNPFNCKQVTRVSLSPKTVQCISWWSKDYGRWIEAWEAADTHTILASYAVHYFNFTINGESNSALEPHVDSPLDTRLRQLEWLVRTFGVDSVNLRFDPIVFYRSRKRDGKLGDLVNNLGYFEKIIGTAASLGIRAVSTKFVNHYAKSVRHMGRAGFVMENLSDEFRVKKFEQLLAFSMDVGVELRLCADQWLSELTGTRASTCVDSEKIDRLFKARRLPPIAVDKKDKPRREGCRCTHTVDLGDYDEMPCPNDCLYCYANPELKGRR